MNISYRINRQEIRNILSIEQNQKILDLVQTTFGRLILITLCTLVLNLEKDDFFYSSFLVLAACIHAYIPKHKALVLLAATQGLSIFRIITASSDFNSVISNVLLQENISDTNTLQFTLYSYFFYILFFVLLIKFTQKNPKSIFAQKPVILSLLIEFILLILSSENIFSGATRAALWSFFIIYTGHIWFLIYAIIDQRSQNPSQLTYQVGVLHSFWGYKSISLPYGKGTNFLKRVYAKNNHELAVTQIKGFKLLVWSYFLYVIHGQLKFFFEGFYHVKTISDEITLYLNSQASTIPVQWMSLIWSQLDFALWVAMWGNLAVSIARLAGFRLPRSTWRPLESRTMLDYFNRIVFYFKEMMVDLFFTPTFFKYFKGRSSLRMFFATFMAAGVGNAIYHFVRDIDIVADVGLTQLFTSYASYLFYSTILAIAISVSQVRLTRGRRPPTSWPGKIWSFACVWGFVIIMRIFGDESRDHTILERTNFLLHLFGVNL